MCSGGITKFEEKRGFPGESWKNRLEIQSVNPKIIDIGKFFFKNIISLTQIIKHKTKLSLLLSFSSYHNIHQSNSINPINMGSTIVAVTIIFVSDE